MLVRIAKRFVKAFHLKSDPLSLKKEEVWCFPVSELTQEPHLLLYLSLVSDFYHIHNKLSHVFELQERSLEIPVVSLMLLSLMIRIVFI